MNPSLAAKMVGERRRELELQARSTSRRPRRRWSISRLLGLALVRAGRRLAGTDELGDRRLRQLVLGDVKHPY